MGAKHRIASFTIETLQPRGLRLRLLLRISFLVHARKYTAGFGIIHTILEIRGGRHSRSGSGMRSLSLREGLQVREGPVMQLSHQGGEGEVRVAFIRSKVSWCTYRCVVLVLVVGLLTGCLSLLFVHENPASATLTPPDFTDTHVMSVDSPTALAFTPDGRLLVTSEPGRLRIYKDGALLANPALDISSKVCTNGARGLLGIAVDPNFATNNFIYLFYTFKKYGVCEQNTAKV